MPNAERTSVWIGKSRTDRQPISFGVKLTNVMTEDAVGWVKG